MLKAPPPTTTNSPPSKNTVYPLRKATYVTIDKLVHSQYNFNEDKLNEELEIALKTKKSEGDNAVNDHETPEDEKENVGASSTSATYPSRTVIPPTSYSTAVASTTSGVADLELEGKNNRTAVDATSRSNESEPGAWTNSPLKALPSGAASQQQSSPVLPPPFYKYHHTHTNRLQPPRDGFNLCVLVGKVDIVVDKLRVDGSRVLVAEVQVGDTTGSISLRARDDQINVLKQVSKDKGAVVLRNCTVELHQGKYLRLAVSKWGKMSVYPDGIESTPDPPLSMNKERNFSLVDLNTVATAKENGPNRSSVSQNYTKLDAKQQPNPKQQQQHNNVQHVEENSPVRPGRSPVYNQRGRKFQHQRRQQPSMYSPQQQYYQPQHQQTHHQGGQAGVPIFYQPFTGGDAGSVYSFQSHSTENSSPTHGQRLYHHPSYQNDHFNHQQQQLMYQQYELQQRHAHQMQMLQETQRRLMAVEHQRLSSHHQQQITHPLVMPLNMIESHEISEDYSIPSTIAMTPSLSAAAYPPLHYPVFHSLPLRWGIPIHLPPFQGCPCYLLQ
eukprot:CCRYP_015332-RA/>CCRYP_015332-RA protein AED:0.18 eAED:0.18 QI:238/1/1/1/1/0.75/4/1259/553